MKLSIEKNVIFKSLSHVQSIVEKKNTIPVLSNILIEAKDNILSLSATDMDLSMKDKVDCNIIEEGSTTVPAHTLYDIISIKHNRKISNNQKVIITLYSSLR